MGAGSTEVSSIQEESGETVGLAGKIAGSRRARSGQWRATATSHISDVDPVLLGVEGRDDRHQVVAVGLVAGGQVVGRTVLDRHGESATTCTFGRKMSVALWETAAVSFVSRSTVVPARYIPTVLMNA